MILEFAEEGSNLLIADDLSLLAERQSPSVKSGYHFAAGSSRIISSDEAGASTENIVNGGGNPCLIREEGFSYQPVRAERICGPRRI